MDWVATAECDACAQYHAILGLGVYTPLIYITGSSVLMGDGVLCYASNPDSHFVIFTYIFMVWLYTIYTAMMCIILYLAFGKVLLKKAFPGMSLL